MRYLKGNIGNRLRLTLESEMTLNHYVNVNWVGDTKDGQLISAIAFKVGDSAINWLSKNQSTVIILSSSDAELVAASFLSRKSCGHVYVIERHGLPTEGTNNLRSQFKLYKIYENEKAST